MKKRIVVTFEDVMKAHKEMTSPRINSSSHYVFIGEEIEEPKPKMCAWINPLDGIVHFYTGDSLIKNHLNTGWRRAPWLDEPA